MGLTTVEVRKKKKDHLANSGWSLNCKKKKKFGINQIKPCFYQCAL